MNQFQLGRFQFFEMECDLIYPYFLKFFLIYY